MDECDFKYMTEAGFECFKRYFLFVNACKKTISHSDKEYSVCHLCSYRIYVVYVYAQVMDFDGLVGLETLWSIALRSRVPVVAEVYVL